MKKYLAGFELIGKVFLDGCGRIDFYSDSIDLINKCVG
jgi:hypothetical protein